MVAIAILGDAIIKNTVHGLPLTRVRKVCIAGLLFCVFLVQGATARELRLITSSSIPPYVIVEGNKGIVTDIMREALALKGYSVHFNYSTNKRLKEELLSRRVDGAFNFPEGSIAEFYYSDPIISYQNVVVGLKSKHFAVHKIGDLSNRSVVAFQNSALFLGPEYESMSRINPRHQEVSAQRSQLFMLFLGRTDLIVLELRIFYHYLQEIESLGGAQSPYIIYPIFPASPRYAVFSKQNVRDDFNDGLKMLHKNGRYDAILKSYIVER